MLKRSKTFRATMTHKPLTATHDNDDHKFYNHIQRKAGEIHQLAGGAFLQPHLQFLTHF